MIVILMNIVCSQPMDPLTVVFVFPSNKKEETVVETWPRIVKENVVMVYNVSILKMVVIYLELAKKPLE